MPAEDNGQAEVTFDFDTLTIDELDLLEDTADASVEDIRSGAVRYGKVYRAWALVLLRRANPDATAADAGRVTVAGLAEMLPERPTTAAGPPATASSAGSPRPRGSRSKGSPR